MTDDTDILHTGVIDDVTISIDGIKIKLISMTSCGRNINITIMGLLNIKQFNSILGRALKIRIFGHAHGATKSILTNSVLVLPCILDAARNAKIIEIRAKIAPTLCWHSPVTSIRENMPVELWFNVRKLSLIDSNAETDILLGMLQYNNSIESLDLTGNRITRDTYSYILEYLGVNRRCKSLTVNVHNINSVIGDRVKENFIITNLYFVECNMPMKLSELTLRNLELTRSSMTSRLIDLAIGLAGLYKNGLGPYTVVEIFNWCNRYYDKFWVKEKIDVATNIHNFIMAKHEDSQQNFLF